MTTTAMTASAAARRDALAERVFQSVFGTWELFGMYLGDQLGYYEALKSGVPVTASELAARAGANPRYTREWLEQQAVAGIVEVEDERAPAEFRRYFLPPGHDEVLADRESLNYLAPLAQITAGAVRPIEQVVKAYREGGGVCYHDYGQDLREGQARMNRAAFLQQLGQEWIPAMPDVQRRLESDPPARAADIGCGVGWSSIGLARCYPNVLVDGFDSDEASIREARGYAADYWVGERVNFSIRNAADPALAGQYDLVMALECVHDMADPVGALRTMRRMVKPDGAVLVVDERVAERFTVQGTATEKLMYGFSMVHCLPSGMAEQPSVGTGAVMRPGTFRGYAREAGFREVEVLPIENLLFRFYRLRQ